MKFKIEGKKEHKGFLLKESVTLDGSILVLTGRNGSGKTRLLESLQNECSISYLNDSLIDKKDIKLVAHASLNPNFGQNYNDTQFQHRITSTLQLYDSIKGDLNKPFDRSKVQVYGRMLEGSIDYESLFKLCVSIGQSLNKNPSELTHDDIILHFEEPLRNILGIQNMSAIANQYIKRLHNNEYNEWRSKEKRSNVKFWSEDEFLNKFGEKPWIVANKILEDTFDGKFLFNIPDEKSQSYSYQAQLIQSENNKPVSIQHLSSGEKTLLWLALTLFNSQYYDSEIAHSPKVLLIDEPDAFLHPKMVLKMYKALDSFKTNFNSIVAISTHSPTTVALAPQEQIYLVENNTISTMEKDGAIAELLDGITQISLNPKNRRQVFVESQYDADVYQAIFSKISFQSKIIDPKISLNFVSSGPKMPEDQLKGKVKQIFNIKNEELLNEFVKSINGVGSCVQVIGQIEALDQNGNETVRGIIDWDIKNNPKSNISVLAYDYAYSIENITLDPICILLLLHLEQPTSFTVESICGESIDWQKWLLNDKLLQSSIDQFILKVLKQVNSKDSKLEYMSGKILLTDSKYLKMNGHKLEQLIKEAYPELRAFSRKGKDGELKLSIVNKSMITYTSGKLIPKVFEHVLADVQK